LIFWVPCLYLLFGKKIKTLFAYAFGVITLCALLNTFVFKSNYSTISNIFTFDSLSGLSSPGIIFVLGIVSPVFICAALAYIINRNKTRLLNAAIGISLISLTVFFIYNAVGIHAGFSKAALAKNSEESNINAITPIFSLSKEKRNIIVIMSDCAINGFVKPIFDEHPALYEQFDGFTLYPNTLSFAMHTIMGVPPIWGGYEYTPKEMNARSDIPLVKKHNEALLMLPTILAGEGGDNDACFRVTVTDPSWANHDPINETSIYKDLKNVSALNTIGRYTPLWYSLNNFTKKSLTSNKINRNALWFSFLKISPPFLRKLIYDDSWYWGADEFVVSITKFLNSYTVLDLLPRLTTYDSAEPSALLITNEATHDLTFLQYPEYKPVEIVSDIGSGEFSSNTYYHINNAFYLKIGEWFDELKKENVYDNTRIIIVSDHGSNTNAKIANTEIPIAGVRREGYNPVLLVKDFYQHGTLKTDMTFMTNADVPSIVLEGIAEKINPFTGKVLDTDEKKDGVYITSNHFPQAYMHGKNKFRISDNEWIFIKDNIFDEKNWEKAAAP
jgi:hypothetical protein